MKKKRKMRLIYIADIRFPMERANAIQSINTCHSLARRGIEVYFVVRKMDDRTDWECLEYYGLKPIKNLKLKRVRVINNHRSFFIWKMSFLISSILNVFKMSFTRKRLIYYTRDLRIASIFSKMAKLFGAKTIFEAHTINHRNFAEIHTLYSSETKLPMRKIRRKERFEGRVYKKMNGLLAITDNLKKQIEADFSPKCEIAVVRDAAEPVKEREPEKVEGICYIGQLYPWKGVDILIQAMKSIKDEKLYIIGGLEYENDLENLKKLAEELNVSNRVKFIGTIPHKKVLDYVKKAKVCVIPLPFSQIAAYYTSPMKMFEYLAAGKAIVASDLPSLGEVLTHEKNALLFKPADSKSLVKQIKRLLKDDDLRKRLEENAWEDSQKYSWQSRARQISKYINNI